MIYAIFCFSIFIFLTARLFQLQVIQSAEYKEKSRQNYERYIQVPAERGRIYDRNFWESPLPDETSLLVMNKSSLYIALVGYYFAGGERNSHIIRRISEVTDIKVPEILNRMERGYLYEPTIIAEDLDFSVFQKLSEAGFNPAAVITSDKPVRVYKYGKLASHVIGYVRPLSKMEYEYYRQKNDPRFNRHSIIGKRGIERFYDKELRGTDGLIKKIVNAGNSLIHSEVVQKAISGNNLILTIDKTYQQMAESVISTHIGAVVLMDAASGEVLAMASSPDYDPNSFIGRISKVEWDRLMYSPDFPLTNRAISGKYPPSSTFKTIASTCFLHPPHRGGRVIDPYDMAKCEMEYFLNEEQEKPYKCLGFHGWINMRRAISQSCNIYFYIMGRRIGHKRIYDMSRFFGLGQKTGIDLPGEVSGFIPNTKWKKRVLRVKWFLGDTLNMAIGQGFTTVTPLQNACVMAGVINDGLIYRPHVLKAIYSSDNKTLLRRIDPRPWKREKHYTLNPEHMKFIRTAMRDVCLTGTAKLAAMPKSLYIIGKTGTAEFNRRKDPHSWFIGYTPFKKRKMKLVVSVLVEEGGPGGSVAAPIAVALLRGVVNEEKVNDVSRIRDHLTWKVKDYYFKRTLKQRNIRKKDHKATDAISDDLFK